MTTNVRQAIAASISPDLVRQACEEAKARSSGSAEDFYAQLAMSLKRRVAAPLPENTPWAVILVAADGGVRAVLSTKAPRFLEPRNMHDDIASGAVSVWFSVHHEDEIAPFASREEAERGVQGVITAIGQPGLSERLRIVPADRKGEQELLVHMAAIVSQAAPEPAKFLSTQVFQAFVNPAKAG
ncbi:hypothetical protein FN976_19805 [Caenimonas sedimenti]|uniref:Uncharacterized protein n=1 Tax=Caenimonas sedimenti TaxID=2596921 RepID=A0A562ZLT3_9BURK|nr:hypothetical protein [Caenimonas sedimenti]TWO69530.1 hypothetical protein FN976_19805 [Caenimonas sedimenti]